MLPVWFRFLTLCFFSIPGQFVRSPCSSTVLRKEREQTTVQILLWRLAL